MAEGLGAGAIFAAINTAFKFSEFVIQLTEVGAENEVFVRTIERVRSDLEQTERLLAIPSTKTYLEGDPQKLEWAKQAVHNTKSSLNDIGLYVERVRSDKDRDGGISFAHRVRWVLKDHGKLENRRSDLAACHQTLSIVLNMLLHLERTTPPPSYGEAFEDFKSPYRRLKDIKTKETGLGTTDTRQIYLNDTTLPQPLPQCVLPVQENTTVYSVQTYGTTGYTNFPSHSSLQESPLSGNNDSGPVDPLNWAGLPAAESIQNRPLVTSPSSVQSPTSITTPALSYFSPVFDTSSTLSCLASGIAMQPDEQFYATIRQAKKATFPIAEMDGLDLNVASNLPSELASDNPEWRPQHPTNHTLPAEMNSVPASYFSNPPVPASPQMTINSQTNSKYRAYSAPEFSYSEGPPSHMSTNIPNTNTFPILGPPYPDESSAQAEIFNRNLTPAPSQRASYSEGMILVTPSTVGSTTKLSPDGGSFQYSNTYSQTPISAYSEGLIHNPGTCTFSASATRTNASPEPLTYVPNQNPNSIPFSLPSARQASTAISYPPHQSPYQLRQAHSPGQHTLKDLTLAQQIQPCKPMASVASPSFSVASIIPEEGTDDKLSVLREAPRQEGVVVSRNGTSKSMRRRGMRDAALNNSSYSSGL